MTIEVKTDLLDVDQNIDLNQLIFLSMILDKNQKANQDVRKIVSLISDDEISYLISQELITSTKTGNSITYLPTEKLTNLLEPSKAYFDLFYDMYPVYVIRPDGHKDYLRANVNKCRKLYNTYVGNSSSMAKHLNKCLEYELSTKLNEGKMSYMKTMWRWLVDHQWEAIEEEMADNNIVHTSIYGTELI